MMSDYYQLNFWSAPNGPPGAERFSCIEDFAALHPECVLSDSEVAWNDKVYSLLEDLLEEVPDFYDEPPEWLVEAANNYLMATELFKLEYSLEFGEDED